MNESELFACFLKSVLQSIEKMGAGEDLLTMASELRQNYENIRAWGKEDAFYEFIKTEYGDNKKICIALLQYIYEMTQISGVLAAYLEMKLEEEILAAGDLFLELNLREQIVHLLFQEGKVIPFGKEWKINEAIAKTGPEKLNMVYAGIKKEERDSDFVVIFVKQILSVMHAPTKLLLEFSRIIQRKLGKKVWIISAVLKTDVELLKQAEIAGNFLITNFIEQRGNCFADYKETRIPVYQLIVEKGNEREMKAVWDKIYELKPFCVWNLAGDPLWTAIAGQFTVSLHTNMRQGYPAVYADAIVNYIPTDRPEDKENKEFLLRRNIAVLETEFLFPYEKPSGNLKRSDVGIPEEAFCLGVAGNRLLTECSDSFLHAILHAAEGDDGIFVRFIGLSESDRTELEKKLDGKLRRFLLTGHEDNLIEHLNLFDLFVNPPRLGGGNTGAMALSVGVPVLTLNKGDIAAVAGREFTVETLDDYPEMIWKYKNDSAFYEGQSKLAQARIKEKTTGDDELAEIIQNVFDEIG